VLEAVRGVERYQFSYWDALIWAQPNFNGVPNIVSEDFSHGRLIEGVRFLNPFIGAFDLTRLTIT
jgi:predicted nucleic acid-binding protein